MTTLDDLLDAGQAKHRAGQAKRQVVAGLGAGFYWSGWALFKLVRLALLVVGGLFWTLGWTARRVVWPALVWIAAAVRLGWEDAHRSGRRVAD